MDEKMCTLIFMDLETTGLPGFVGKKNVHITELSLVAIDRNSFEDDKNLRVVNKLCLCIRPRTLISPGAMDITGLYNDMLSSQEEFNDSIPKLLEYFFQRLKPPICLLAHNGNRFDFPVLQAELKRINYALSDSILCADTLVALRDICLSPDKQEIKASISEPRPSDKVSSDDEIEELLSNDIELFCSIPLDAGISNLRNGVSHLEECHDHDKPTPSFISQIECGEKTHVQNKNNLPELLEFLPLGEKTPTSRTTVSNNMLKCKKRKLLDPCKLATEESKKNCSSVKRNLFPEDEYVNHVPKKITKFSLESLYKHFFNESVPNGHHAEIDCISLSKVCQQFNKKFLKWIDEKSVPFCSVQPMW